MYIFVVSYIYVYVDPSRFKPCIRYPVAEIRGSWLGVLTYPLLVLAFLV